MHLNNDSRSQKSIPIVLCVILRDDFDLETYVYGTQSVCEDLDHLAMGCFAPSSLASCSKSHRHLFVAFNYYIRIHTRGIYTE